MIIENVCEYYIKTIHRKHEKLGAWGGGGISWLLVRSLDPSLGETRDSYMIFQSRFRLFLR